jgi:hypothetical protein
MPPTLELDFEPVEKLAYGAARAGSLPPSQVQWAEDFLKNAEARLLNIYEGARILSQRLYDRDEVADYWRQNAESFGEILEHVRKIQNTLQASQLPEPEGLEKIIQTTTDILAACRGAYELHA